jgi:hypothetical protein
MKKYQIHDIIFFIDHWYFYLLMAPFPIFQLLVHLHHWKFLRLTKFLLLYI